MSLEPEEIIDSWEDEDDEVELCDVCGAELIDGHPENDGCPYCLSCGGLFAPGSEECDWCKWSDLCAEYAGTYK